MKNYNFNLNLLNRICVFNDTRLIRYDSYMLDEVSYCTNDKYCINTKTNQSFECPLWTAYCKTYYDIEAKLNVTKNVTILPEDEKLEDFVDDPIHERYAYLCHYFEEKNSVVLKAGIPGISSKDVIRGMCYIEFINNFIIRFLNNFVCFF